jgi:hypothetical protein
MVVDEADPKKLLKALLNGFRISPTKPHRDTESSKLIIQTKSKAVPPRLTIDHASRCGNNSSQNAPSSQTKGPLAIGISEPFSQLKK